MTDPSGRMFISLESAQATVVTRLVAALREVGVPSWWYEPDMGTTSFVDKLRKTLDAEDLAGAILWITDEMATRAWVAEEELPWIGARLRRGDGFLLVPVAVGVSRERAAALVGRHLGGADLSAHFVVEVASPPTPRQLREVAERALAERVAAWSRRHAEEPIAVRLSAWQTATGFVPGYALDLDWTAAFRDKRHATPTAWKRFLAALRAARAELDRHAPGRPVVASGQACLSATTALGATFPSPSGRRVDWSQVSPDGSRQVYSLQAPRLATGFTVVERARHPAGRDLAVLLSLNNDVRPAFYATDCPAIRTVLEVLPPGSTEREAPRFTITDPGQARDIVETTIEAVRGLRSRVGFATIHWFVAAPAGLGLLLGQSLNTFGPCQLYELVEDDKPKRYRPSVVVEAGR